MSGPEPDSSPRRRARGNPICLVGNSRAVNVSGRRSAWWPSAARRSACCPARRFSAWPVTRPRPRTPRGTRWRAARAAAIGPSTPVTATTVACSSRSPPGRPTAVRPTRRGPTWPPVNSRSRWPREPWPGRAGARGPARTPAAGKDRPSGTPHPPPPPRPHRRPRTRRPRPVRRPPRRTPSCPATPCSPSPPRTACPADGRPCTKPTATPSPTRPRSTPARCCGSADLHQVPPVTTLQDAHRAAASPLNGGGGVAPGGGHPEPVPGRVLDQDRHELTGSGGRRTGDGCPGPPAPPGRRPSGVQGAELGRESLHHRGDRGRVRPERWSSPTSKTDRSRPVIRHPVPEPPAETTNPDHTRRSTAAGHRRSGRCSTALPARIKRGDLPEPGGQGPDHRDVKSDDHQRPDRVVRDEQEVGQRGEHRDDDADHPGPRLTGEDEETGDHEHDSQDQVNPSPTGPVTRIGTPVQQNRHTRPRPGRQLRLPPPPHPPAAPITRISPEPAAGAPLTPLPPAARDDPREVPARRRSERGRRKRKPRRHADFRRVQPPVEMSPVRPGRASPRARSQRASGQPSKRSPTRTPTLGRRRRPRRQRSPPRPRRRRQTLPAQPPNDQLQRPLPGHRPPPTSIPNPPRTSDDRAVQDPVPILVAGHIRAHVATPRGVLLDRDRPQRDAGWAPVFVAPLTVTRGRPRRRLQCARARDA